MIPNHLSALWVAIAPALGNHLWQSTMCIIVAGLLTLTLRRNHARARYGLWLAASVKFLIPFALLVGIGSHLAKPRVLPSTEPGFVLAMQEVSQPFTQAATGSQVAEKSRRPGQDAGLRYRLAHLLPAILVVMWFCGCLLILFVWYARWRRISAAAREAAPLGEGRELQMLRRLERLAGIPNRIELLLSPDSLEPGIFGIVRPVLVWPEGFSAQLEGTHLEAILAHEVWHVRRRDNLAAAIHMVVEAIFWFHPLVWWLGARLVEERERACDEEVLQLGSKRRVYAESILKTCEFCVESPLACVSGVTGADLKKRIVRIMTEGVRHKLDTRRMILLTLATSLVVAAPIGFGLAHGQAGQATAPQSATPSPAGNSLATTATFEVASIKPEKPSGPRMMFRIMNSANSGRFSAAGSTLKMLLRVAYHVQDSQIIGGPSWINSDRYDIEAKADSSTDEALRKMSEGEARLVRMHMLQALLADRFQLKLHHGTKDLPVYALVVAKNGPKLEKAKDDASLPPLGPGGAGGPGPNRGVFMQVNGGEQQLSFQDSPLTFFTEVLAQSLGRTVVDKTGLDGKYNFKLHWVPEMGMLPMGGPGPGGPAGPGGNEPIAAGAPSSPDTSGPSIFTAIQEQLGLKLESTKGPVDVLVIDHVEQPSEN